MASKISNMISTDSVTMFALVKNFSWSPHSHSQFQITFLCWTLWTYINVFMFYILYFQFSSVQFSCSVMSDSLQPHELQHASLPVHHQLPQFTEPRGPLSRWCHPAISSSVIPFSSCLQSLPASGSFPMSQLFT